MDYISLHIENHMARVTLKRPPVNAFTIQMYRELGVAFRRINGDPEVWVALLAAEGKHFSTGNDVNEFKDLTTPESAVRYAASVSEGVTSVYDCRVPVIAAVNGMALGAGLAIATCCDIIVAAENALFGLPEIRVGIVGAACFISRFLPQHLHRYMAYSGEMISAGQMKHHGAVIKTVPAEGLEEAASGAARRLLENPPRALELFKKAMNRNESPLLGEKYAGEISLGSALVGSRDFTEAVSAFLEKRKPHYTGS